MVALAYTGPRKTELGPTNLIGQLIAPNFTSLSSKIDPGQITTATAST